MIKNQNQKILELDENLTKKKLIDQIEFETKLVNFYHIKKY